MSAPGLVCPYCHRAAELVTGAVIYPHRPDLLHRRFWRCEPCGAYVGCHRPNRRLGLKGVEPLGRLANAELRRERNRAHAAFDPLWQSGSLERGAAYAWLADAIGVTPENMHIGMLDVDGCRAVVAAVRARRAEGGRP